MNEDVATGSSVAMVTAVDRDSGAGGEVQFTIMEGEPVQSEIITCSIVQPISTSSCILMHVHSMGLLFSISS